MGTSLQDTQQQHAASARPSEVGWRRGECSDGGPVCGEPVWLLQQDHHQHQQQPTNPPGDQDPGVDLHHAAAIAAALPLWVMIWRVARGDRGRRDKGQCGAWGVEMCVIREMVVGGGGWFSSFCARTTHVTDAARLWWWRPAKYATTSVPTHNKHTPHTQRNKHTVMAPRPSS